MTAPIRLVTTSEEYARENGEELDEHRLQDRLQTCLHGIAQGNDAALTEFYTASVDRVYHFAHKLLSSPADAEEITEDVFLYVWRNADRYDASRGPVVAWLMTMTRSRSIDRLRQRQRQDRVSLAMAQEPQELESSEVGVALLNHRKLGDCIRTLPKVQQQVLLLAYGKGMTQQEISDTLELSLGTVKTHVRRTVIALRQLVDH